MPPVTVLIVDDDTPFRRMAAELLTARGFLVIAQAADAEQALTECTRTRPDAALVDVNLPGTDGLELSRSLSRTDSSPRVLLTSTDAQAAGPDAVAQAGAIGFVAKSELAVTDLAPHLGS
jgi:two-component system response regulator DesR